MIISRNDDVGAAKINVKHGRYSRNTWNIHVIVLTILTPNVFGLSVQMKNKHLHVVCSFIFYYARLSIIL